MFVKDSNHLFSLTTMTIARSCLRLSLPLLLTLGSVAPTWAAEVTRTLAVTGKGTTRVATTLTQVRLAVEVSGKNSATVQQNAANRAAKVIAFLKSRQVDKLQTTGISLNPIYSYENNRQTLTGYMANNSVSFQVPTNKAGPIMDGAVGAGATRIESVSSIASETAVEGAQTTAIQSAAKDAQRQAQAILSSLGLQQKEIIGIQVNDASRPAPIYANAEALKRTMAVSADAPTEVIGGEQEVQATVTLQIRY
jgi:uncharacterized protein